MAEYTDMTDEEYDALDEELTCTIPKIKQNGNDWLAQKEFYRLGMTNLTVNYLLTKAAAKNMSLAQVVDELVRKEMAATV